MRHFHSLALLDELGSLTEAAHVLSLTQPAASKILIEVEQAFGTPLFERGRGGVHPTASERAAIRRARTMMGEMASMKLPPMCLITRRAEEISALVKRFADCIRAASGS